MSAVRRAGEGTRAGPGKRGRRSAPVGKREKQTSIRRKKQVHALKPGRMLLRQKNPESGENEVPGTARDRPTPEQIRSELERTRNHRQLRQVVRSTVYALVVAAAAAVLIAVMVTPVFRIYGSSMEPTLTEGDLVVTVKGTDLDAGDLVVFYYENKVLIKRYIAGPGQWVDIDEDGNVYVDGQLLDEPYLTEKALGECDIELPYQVPDGRIFVLGDHRSTSVDSRSTSVGCVSEEQIVGRIVFRVWPLSGLGTIN